MENNLKRFLSLLLALVMVIGLMPVGHVHAEEGNTINLVVGDTHEITLDGDYSSLNGTGNEVVSVDAEFTPKLTAYTVSNTTTDATLESGKYVLQNTRVSKFLESTSEGGKLWLAAKLITTAETWTITKVDDGYTMKASNGQYLTFDGSSSSLTDTETVLSFTWKDTSTWQIGCGGQYLNSYDSEQKVAGWWQDGDGGSQWRLYKVTDQPAYTWTLGDAVSQIEDGGYYIFENNEASSRAASLVSSKWNNTNNGGGGSGYGLLMEHNKTNFGEQDIWKITGTAGEYHVQDYHGWNLLVASGKATLTPESQTTVIGQDSTSYEGKWQISVGGVHLNWWGGSNGDGVQVAGWGDVNDRNSQWNIYEVIPTALGSTTITFTAQQAGTAEITIGDTTYHIHVTDGTGEHEHSYTGEVTTAATCTENGEMTYTCVCGERYTEVIPATGHAPVTTGYKKPTLCEPGATGTTSCGVCGEVFSESTAINQLPVASVLHDNKIVALNGCEYTYNASNSSFTHTDANGTVYSVKPSAGVGVQQPALIPQTTAEVFSVSLIWGSGDFAGRVQISGNGSIHFHTNADKPYWNKCGSGSGENSDWTNHGLYLFVAGGDSAEFPGYTQVTSAEGMVDGGHYLIAARTDDDHGGKWYVMRPTAGTNEFMHVAQYTGMKEITGHTPGEKVRVNEVAATCGAAGSYDEVIYCTVCSAELSRETIAIDALGHNYEAVVTAPTCTEPGYTTYTCSVCGDSYVADETPAEHSYEKGFCTVCGGYEVPELNAEGYYEIGNAGQLYWFADQVNNGANNINAILTDKIVVNENLMEKITIAEDGTATVNEGETIREWAPIGGSIYPYSGTFDGNGKTVTGLYRNVSANYVGLIGYLEGSGKVQNVTVADSYFCGGNCVGGVVGYSCAGSTVSNCHNTGSVSGGDDVGGVVGNNGGSMTECCNAGTVSGSNYVGGVAGWNADSTLSNCYNTGTVSGNDYVGGVAGFCFTATLSNCYNTGTVSGGDYVGGVVGLNDDGGTVSNCYNTGTVSGGGYVGGVVGYCYIGGTVSNCYNTGSINAGMFNGGVVGVNNGTMSNCFYLDTCGAEGEGTAKTEAQFASGEVAWLLNGSTDEGELVWKQNIGTDAIPGFEGEIVSYSSKTGAYYNKGNHEHQYEAVVTDPTCTEPGYTTYTCAVCGDTYVGDETTALGHTASEAVKEHEVAPTLNSEGSYDSVVYCSVCSAELSRTTITVPALQGAVAQVNGVKYATLNEAIEKASGNMAVHMLSDVTEDIVIDKALILLMNSHTLYGQVKITGPNVQIQGCINTSTDPKGKIVAEGKDAIVIGVKDQKNENISVYANFVDVTSTTDCALLIYDGKATFNNSDLTSTSTSYAAVQGSGRDFGDVSMSLCNVTSEHEVAIYWPHVGTLTVNNDCTITGATGLYIKQGKANLYSCTVKGTGAQVAHKVNNNGGDSTGDAITIDKGATEPVVNTSANLISENGNLVGMYGGTVELFGANLTAKKNAIRMEDGVLTLRGMTINAGYCALFIRGGEVNINGTTMNSTGDYATIQGNGTCGGDVTIRSGTVSSANNIAIYWPGSGNLTVMDATVTGATAIYAKQGNVTISGGTFRATGEKADFSHSGNGAYATGDAVVLESCDYGTLTASITYGRFISDHGKAVAAYAQPGHTELSGFITGGHYNTAVDADYLAEGYCAALTGEYYSVAQHYYFSEVTDPDCENGGYTTHTCGRCGDSYITDEIPALGHTEEVIPGKDATCTETGLTEGKKCTVCGETTVAQQEIPALGHKPGETVIENEKAATCTETGSYDTVVYCSVCSEELSRETTTVDALGHKEEAIPGKDPTCTETGLTEGKKCTVCGETTVAQQEIPALGHDWLEDGSCSRCEEKKEEEMENPFVDVPVDEYYLEPVLWAVGKGITSGTSENTFSPYRIITRGQAVTFLWRAMGSPEPAMTINPFVDVTETDYYYKAVLWAAEKGITAGVGDNRFAPGQECTRAQILTFLWVAMDKPASNVEVNFNDVHEGDYYYNAVAWAYENGITAGMGGGAFGVGILCTRAHVITFLYRAAA